MAMTFAFTDHYDTMMVDWERERERGGGKEGGGRDLQLII